MNYDLPYPAASSGVPSKMHMVPLPLGMEAKNASEGGATGPKADKAGNEQLGQDPGAFLERLLRIQIGSTGTDVFATVFRRGRAAVGTGN